MLNTFLKHHENIYELQAYATLTVTAWSISKTCQELSDVPFEVLFTSTILEHFYNI